MKTRTSNYSGILSTNASFSRQTIDFSKVNQDKIEEYIELMEEHQLECEQSGNFIEAELARQRVLQLMKIKEKKDYKNAKKRQAKEKEDLSSKQNAELKEFNKKLDLQYAELMSKFEQMKNELNIKHENELHEFIENFENNYPTEPKISNELANAKKQLEYYVKQKDYPNAHLKQVEIQEIAEKDLEKFEMEKEKKIDKEIGALRVRQKNEADALELKIAIHQNKFQRERSMKTEEIILKYKNKARGLENTQKAEREQYERIIRGQGLKPRNINTMKNTSRSMPKNIEK